MAEQQWHKKTDARGGFSVTVGYDGVGPGDPGIYLHLIDPMSATRRETMVYLTPNQAGDIAHALEEAIEHYGT